MYQKIWDGEQNYESKIVGRFPCENSVYIFHNNHRVKITRKGNMIYLLLMKSIFCNNTVETTERLNSSQRAESILQFY